MNDAIVEEKPISDLWRWTLLTAAIGIPFGALVCSVGVLLVVLIMDAAFSPPLRKVESFGQFGFLLLYSGFFGAVYGLSYCLILRFRFWVWLLSFAMITLAFLVVEPELSDYLSPDGVVGASYSCIAFFLISAGCFLSFLTSRLKFEE